MSANKPNHIAIILDGNRRFAKKLLMKPWEGHDKGFEKLKEIFNWCVELDIKELTLYCFSIQNFNRPKDEFEHIMNIFVKAANEVISNEDVHNNKIRVRLLGRRELLPEKVQEAMKAAEEATKDYSDFRVNLCLAYGGREEIVDAAKRIAEDVKQGKLNSEEIDEKIFSKYLYLDSYPDLVIRTSGEKRTSNFLPWQSTYSEWFFPKKMWPEFEKEDLIEIIEKFVNIRKRRYGE